MPTYSFRCAGCGNSFEFILGIEDRESVTDCPTCGCPIRRVFDAPRLRSVPSGLARAADFADASAEAPQVVNTVPPAAWAPNRPARDRRYPALPRP